MTLQPLIDAGWAVQAHVATVIPCFVLGTWLVFFSNKGSPLHRAVGVGFLSLMVVTATLTLFIHRRWPQSPLFGLSIFHLMFVPLTYVGVWRALLGVRRKDLRMHKLWIGVLYWFLLVWVGIMNAAVFPGVTRDMAFPAKAGDQTIFGIGPK